MSRYKLVWFVPSDALDATRDAVFGAGAGQIGKYERCSWYTEGTGTFVAGEGAEPAIGEVGSEERVRELRVETVVRSERVRAVVAALVAAHPYEEVAFELYPLAQLAPSKAKLSTDGAARGNPGPAAYGYVLEAEGGTILAERGEKIGRATNNVAEYRGLVAGLAKALELGLSEVAVVSDSQLLVKQMTGEYRVKNEALRQLSVEAARLARQIGAVTYSAVPREHNELADRLANEALDRD